MTSPRLRVRELAVDAEGQLPGARVGRADDVDRILDEVDRAVAEGEVDTAGMLAAETPLAHVLQLQAGVFPPVV